MRPHTILFLIAVLATSCVSSRKYEETRLAKDYWEQEADVVDSLRQELIKVQEELRESDKHLADSYHDLELLESTNQNLNTNYQGILNKYKALAKQNTDVLDVSSLERKDLTEALAGKQTLIDQKERELAELERMLRQRESRLDVAQKSVNDMQYAIHEREARIGELSRLLDEEQKRMSNLNTSVTNDFRGYSGEDLNVRNEGGKLYVGLSENLLFQKGSDKVGINGQRAIQQLAQTLKSNPDVAIVVEGHTDADGNDIFNWDLSVRRAVTVVKELVSRGVNPARITAAGRSSYYPITSSKSEFAKAKNRRVEVILSTNSEELLNQLR